MEKVCENNSISKEDLMNYTFYDDQHNLVLCLNEERIKKLYDVDMVILHETYR